MRRVRIYLLFHDGVFRDAYASFSEAMLHKDSGGCCVIREVDRYEY